MKYTMEDIIVQNLDLQTTKRKLNKLGIYSPSLELFKSARFVNTYKAWDENKQKEFARTVGGARYQQVKKLMEKL